MNFNKNMEPTLAASNCGVIPLLEGFKRSFLRDDTGNDLVYKDGGSDQILFSVLDAIERIRPYKLNEQNYIVLSDWE